MEWLKRSYVGTLKQVIHIKTAQVGMSGKGISTSMKILKGWKVVITFEDEDQMNIILYLYPEVLGVRFEFVNRIKSSQEGNIIKSWFIIEGISLHLWHRNVFNAIVREWGRGVQLDRPTIRSERFDRVRILIEITNEQKVSQTTHLKINRLSISFMIRNEDKRNRVMDVKDIKRLECLK